MSVLQKLRQAVDQQTVAIGLPVTNLVGPVPAEVIPLLVAVDSAWLELRVPGVRFMTPDEFYTRYATLDQRIVRELQADGDGQVVDRSTDPVTFLLRGVADVAGTLSVPMAVVTGAGKDEWAVYVDGTPLRRGTGELSFSVNLTEGRHTFEIVIASTIFGVRVSPILRIQPLRDVLAAPTWASIDPGYADPRTGSPAVKLGWYTDPRAGGWSVLRRELTDVAPIYHLTEASEHGDFAVEVPGDVTTDIPIGATAYAGLERMGVVLTTAFDAAATVTYQSVLYTGLTTVRLQMPADRAFVNDFWLGRMLGTGVFRELTRVQRVGVDLIVTAVDTTVVYGDPYEYALQAYGLFDPAALSPMSEIRYIRAGDVIPPGPIMINGRDFEDPVPDDPDAPYPSVLNLQATVLFDTPEDEDYAGVRVYFRYVAQTGVPAAVDATSLTLPLPPPTGDLTGYEIQILEGTGAGQVRKIESFAGSVIHLYAGDDWLVPPDGGTFELYKLVPVMTDYGLPNTSDQFTFSVLMDPADPSLPLFGTYYFSSFDLAGNEQDTTTAVQWVFGEDDNGFLGENQPPVVGLRQLGKLEQESYLDLNGQPRYPTLNYSVVELTARDPVDELVGVVIEYRTRKYTEGTSDGANSPDTLNDADAVGFDATGQPASSAGWAINEHKGYLVEINNGTGAGQQRMIVANTVNQLQIDPTTPWDTIPDGTSEYEVAWVTGLAADLVGTSIDDPLGTRSRFVVVSKTDGQNWLQVRAKDKEGLYSDLLTYRPDFDNIPEISSLEIRIDTALDRVYVTGAVDDDTQSFRWWLEPGGPGLPTSPDLGGTPDETFSDTSVLKSFPIESAGTAEDRTFDFRLDDGTKQTLVLRPYSGRNFTGVAGPDFRREISRSPRTVYVWEPKTPGGDTSAVSVKLTFFCTPKIGILHGAPLDDGTPTAYLTGADNATYTLADSSASWAVSDQGLGEFRPDPTNYTQYWVRIINPESGIEQFAPIINNTATTLTLEHWFDPRYKDPAVPFTGQDGTVYTVADWAFEIRNGVTQWKSWEAGGTGAGSDVPWIPTYDPDFFERKPVVPTYVQFRSLLSGVPAEEIHTAIFDRDDLPSFETLSVTLFGTSQLEIKIDGWDDDTKSWICFARKNHSPTLGPDNITQEGSAGPQKGALDTNFRKFEGLVRTATDFTMNVGDGTWYITACPINSKGEYGTCHTRIVTVTIPDTLPPVLTSVNATTSDDDPTRGNPGVDGADAWNLIQWLHNDGVTSGDTDVTLKIFAYRLDRQEQGEIEITAGTGPDGGERLPWQDAMTGSTSTRLFPTGGLTNQEQRRLDIDEPGTDAANVSYTVQGSFLHQTGQIVNGQLVPDKRGLPATGGRDQTWHYRLELHKDGEVVDVKEKEATSCYQSTGVVPAFVGGYGLAKVTGGTVVYQDAVPPVAVNGTPFTVIPLQFRITWELDPNLLNGTDYAVRIDWSDDGINFATIGAAAADRQFGSYLVYTPYVEWQRIQRNYQTLTVNLQFLDQPGGDGVGYQDFDAMGPNVVVTEMKAALATNAAGTLGVLPQFSGGFPTYTVETSSNGSPAGAIRIHNTLATTTQQIIWASYQADAPLVGVTLRRFQARLRIIRTATGEIISENPGFFYMNLTVGTVPSDGMITD